MNYNRICFVIMPFDCKKVGGKMVNFNKIYTEIFEPAVSSVALPEGGMLEPRRTDKDFFSGDIKLEMFRYLEYSRFALADISGLNFNVAYELGARHRVREAGTAIFHQSQAPIPFDISSIKAFPYEYEPEEHASESRALIKRVLEESLRQNRLDSPVRIALDLQQEQIFQGRSLDERLKDAENAIRNQDWTEASAIYREILAKVPDNALVRMRLGLLFKDRGMWQEALEQFEVAAVTSPGMGEAFREKGIAENKVAQKSKWPLDGDPAPGEAALRRAIEINDRDFDAQASLGGVLKRAGRLAPACEAYARSVEISVGHPYPLLNEIKLRANTLGRLDLTGSDRRALARAERVREVQTKQDPAYDKPWCFFDLAEIHLYDGRQQDFVELLKAGVRQTEADWQVQTCLDSLRLLLPAEADLPGLHRGIDLLERWLD